MLVQMCQVYMFLYLENATIFILLYLVNVCWIKFTENVLLFVFYVNVLKIYMFLYLKKYNKENLLSTKFFLLQMYQVYMFLYLEKYNNFHILVPRKCVLVKIF